MRYFWDPERQVGAAFADRLALHQFAWDIYMVFGAGVTWRDTPVPTFYMHQLSGLEDRAPFLDSIGLKVAIDSLIELKTE